MDQGDHGDHGVGWWTRSTEVVRLHFAYDDPSGESGEECPMTDKRKAIWVKPRKDHARTGAQNQQVGSGYNPQAGCGGRSPTQLMWRNREKK